MAIQSERAQIDGSINIDGSIFQYQVEFTGGGGGGGTGDVGWANGNVGSNNQILTAAGDGSIYGESGVTYDFVTKIFTIDSSMTTTDQAAGDNLSIYGGEHSAGGTPGTLGLYGGKTNGGTGGGVTVQGGQGAGTGGNVLIKGGAPSSTGVGGNVSIEAGDGLGGTNGIIDLGITTITEVRIHNVPTGTPGNSEILYVDAGVANAIKRVNGGLPVANGGTGLTTVGTNYLLTGNGTSAMTAESTLTFDGTVVTAPNIELNAQDKQYISGAAATDTVGISVKSASFPTTDYHHMYYKGSNNYGGIFHRQGTSNSDLRQDYNYLRWYTSGAGATSYQRFGFSTTGFVFNEDSQNMDFRIESDSRPYMFFVDGGNNFIGLNEVTPNCTLDASGTIRSTGKDAPAQGSGMELYWNGDPIGNGTGNLLSYSRTLATYQPMQLTSSNFELFSGTTPVETMTAFGTGVVFNETSLDMNFRVETATEEYSIYADGATDQVHLGALGGGTIAARLGYAQVTIGNDYAWSTSATVNTDNLMLYAYNRAEAVGNMGATISFSGPGHGATPATSNRRHTAFGGMQTGTDDDQIGFSWWTHNGTSSTVAISESMRLSHAGQLDVKANVVAYSTVPSDERIKENIETLENSLEKVLQLRGVEYDNIYRKEDGRKSGLIAQEVEKIIPSVVSENTLALLTGDNETLFKTIDYQALVPYLVESMKEQQTIISDQQKEIDELKEKMNIILEKIKI